MAKIKSRARGVRTTKVRVDLMSVTTPITSDSLMLECVEWRTNEPNVKVLVTIGMLEIPRLAFLIHGHLDRQYDKILQARKALHQSVGR